MRCAAATADAISTMPCTPGTVCERIETLMPLAVLTHPEKTCRVILAGDWKQLGERQRGEGTTSFTAAAHLSRLRAGPVIHNADCKRPKRVNLAESLLARLQRLHGGDTFDKRCV